MSSSRTGSLPVLAATALLVACSAPNPQERFWSDLDVLCGNAFAGTVVEAPAGDTAFTGKELVMHVRSCQENEIRIPFHVGADRSRTWVLTRTGTGLRLKHDHRHEDGTEDAVTQYGGDTDGWTGYFERNSAEVARDVGTPTRGGEAGRQEFPADAHTAELIPAAVSNIWTFEIEPGRRFAYALRRVGTDRRFRVEFDLTTPVPSPPAPWGSLE